MKAVVETGGKQYLVKSGDVLSVEKLDVEAGKKVALDKVLLVIDGNDTVVGTPYVDGAKVNTTVIENGKGEKVIVFKYKPKKDERKKQGHRQPYTMLKVDSISVGGKTEEAPKAEKKAAAPKKAAEKKEAAPKAEATEKKPAAKKAAAPKAEAAEKKPAAKKTATTKEATEKKPAAKKTTAKKAAEEK